MNESGRQALWRSFRRALHIEMGGILYRNQTMVLRPGTTDRENPANLMPGLIVADDLVPYCLRHTFCTDQQQNGTSLTMTQYLMGHADVKMTANTYTHTGLEDVIELAKVRKEREETNHESTDRPLHLVV